MLKILFKGPFESAGCAFDRDGWVTTDLAQGQLIKWVPTARQSFRFDVVDGAWLPSAETRDQFLALARQYQSQVTRRN